MPAAKGPGQLHPSFPETTQYASPTKMDWSWPIELKCQQDKPSHVNQISGSRPTDGRPSDQKKIGSELHPHRLSQSTWVLQRVVEAVQRIASSLTNRCFFTFVSFGAASSGKRNHDFLVQLRDAAKQAGSDAKAIDTETSTERLGC